MKKLKLTQAEIDNLETVGRVLVNPTVCGVGLNDVDFEVGFQRNQIWQYRLWKSMLQRCFCEKFIAKNPTYKDVTVCDEWLSFGNFIEWSNKEVGYGGAVGMELDKDLTARGNRVYSPETCSFVPRDVNVLLTNHRAARGEWPVGVCFHNLTGKFVVQLSVGGKQKNLGLFNTPEDAFAVYKMAKEAHIKVVALRYKDVLKSTVFESLMNWSIEP